MTERFMTPAQAVASAIAAQATEGLHMSEEGIALAHQVARGEVSPRDATAYLVRRAKAAQAALDASTPGQAG